MQHPVLWAMMRQARQARQAGLVLAVPRSSQAGVPRVAGPRAGWLTLGCAWYQPPFWDCVQESGCDRSVSHRVWHFAATARESANRSGANHQVTPEPGISIQPRLVSLARCCCSSRLHDLSLPLPPWRPGGLREEANGNRSAERNQQEKDWTHFIAHLHDNKSSSEVFFWDPN